MRQQRVLSVEHPRHGVLLMGSQGDFRVHTRKTDMGTVIFAGTDAVELLIVPLAEGFPAYRVFENPVLERFAHGFLFLLGNGGFLFVEDAHLLSVLHLCIEYPHIPLV